MDTDLPRIRRERRPRRRRVAALLAYDGAGFRGFQRQPSQRTVEGELVRVLGELGWGEGLGFASRTDAGVHALGQVVAFRVPDTTPLDDIRTHLGAGLPPDLSLGALAWAPARFHPRWSAIGKRYEYTLPPDAPAPDTLAAGLEALRRAPALDGFTAAGAKPTPTPAPPLTRLDEVARDGRRILVFEGPAFRRYAIRHMVGALVAEGRGELPAGSCAAIAAATPPYRGPRADADGLVLVRVDYPPALDPFAT